MTGRVLVQDQQVVKAYADTNACRTALANYRALAGLNDRPAIPHLLAAEDTRLVFARVRGRPAEPADLIDVAVALGRLDRAACQAMPGTADQNQPAALGSTTIPGFSEHRHHLVQQLLHRTPPDEVLITDIDVDRMFAAASRWPAAIYKDANPRNFIIGAAEPPVTIVDFDDLTLAPFGYDLAKLVVTVAMTRGRQDPGLIQETLRAYNDAATAPHGAAPPCPPHRFRMFCEIHHLLTVSYLGRHGYHHRWPNVRPWSSLEGR